MDSIPITRTTKGQIPTSSILRISDDKTMQLIELYQEEECLWNINHEDYRKRGKRHEAFCRIASRLSIPHFSARHVTMKFKNLRNSYSQELKKIEAKKAHVIPYKPSVFWFDKISFIAPYLQKPKPSRAPFIINSLSDSYVRYKLVGGVLKQKDPLSYYMKKKKSKTAKQQSKIEGSASTSKTEECEELAVVGNDESDPIMLIYEKTKAQPEEALKVVIVEPSGSENKPEDLLTKKRNIQNTPNTTSSKRLRKDSEPDEQNKTGDKKFEDLSLDDQKTVGSFLEDLSANLHDLISRHNDYFDDFGRYVASLMRSLPQGKALEVQPQIISLITVAGLKNLGSQGENQESQSGVVKIKNEIDESVLDDS